MDTQVLSLVTELLEDIKMGAPLEYRRPDNYPDGTPIPKSLPPRYQPADNSGVPWPQKCQNCSYYNPVNDRCSRWNNAKVKPQYWCTHWKPDPVDNPMWPISVDHN